MQKPIVKSKIQDKTSLEILVTFQKNSEYFDGHFDEFAVLPGVVQINYVMLCAEEYFGITPDISGITKLKFTKIIQPDMDIFLKIEYIEDSGKITFKYFMDDAIYSSGNINLEV